MTDARLRYRKLGGEAEEVGFLGDDALLLRCAIDELARRGARRDRLLMLSTRDRPCRAAEWYGLATAFLDEEYQTEAFPDDEGGANEMWS